MGEEKKMNKFLLILLLAFGLTSCGGDDLSSVLARISKNQVNDARMFKKSLDSITAAYNGAGFQDALLQFETTIYAFDYDAAHLTEINNDFAAFTKKEAARVEKEIDKAEGYGVVAVGSKVLIYFEKTIDIKPS